MMNRSLLPTLLLLFLIFSASDELMGRTAEARVCKSQSHRFHGTCFSNHNCAVVCRTEGFSGGDCVGFRRRCFCTRHC